VGGDLEEGEKKGQVVEDDDDEDKGDEDEGGVEREMGEEDCANWVNVVGVGVEVGEIGSNPGIKAGS